jgi:hypothetical protein
MAESRSKTETIQQTIERLDQFVKRMERRYEMSSDQMTKLVQSGRFPETSEIAQWLTTHRRLQDFRSHLSGGATTGTRSIAI